MGISTFFGLNVGLTALQTAQQAEAVISNNIANANTAGYTQETVTIQESDPYPPLPSTNAPIMGGQLGQGALISQVQRTTNAFLDRQDRMNQGTYNKYSVLSQNLTQIEQIVNEPSSSSLQNALDSFFSSWQTLSTDPSDISARQTVISEGQTLGQTFQTVTSQLEDMQTNLTQTVTGQMQQLNLYAQQVASLNQQIVAIDNMNKSGQPLVENPNQLEDQRGAILDAMATLTNISYTTNSDGSIDVTIVGTGTPVTLVSDGSYFTLDTGSVLPPNGSYYIGSGTSPQWTGPTGAFTLTLMTGSNGIATGTYKNFNLQTINSGQIAGNTQSLDEVNKTMSELDSFLTTFSNQVNTIQTSGYSLNGSPPSKAFFTLSTTTNDNIILQVNQNLTPQDIAAATGNSSGNNGNALNMVNEAWNGFPATGSSFTYFSIANNTTVTMTSSTGATFDQMLASYVSDLGVDTAAANSNEQTANALAQQSSTLRQSVSSVDINEQAANMLVYQNIFDAASKFISIFDQMLQTAINMV